MKTRSNCEIGTLIAQFNAEAQDIINAINCAVEIPDKNHKKDPRR